MGLRVGVGDPTRHVLRMHLRFAHETEHWHSARQSARVSVTGLLRTLAEVNRAAIQAWRRSGFQSALGKLQLFQAGGQTHRRWIARTATRIVVHSDVNFSIQECARREHHGSCLKANSRLGDRTRHALVHTVGADHQIFYRLLKQPQVWLVFQHTTNRGLVQNAISLCAGGSHCRAFGTVQNSKLNARFISRQSHRAA